MNTLKKILTTSLFTGLAFITAIQTGCKKKTDTPPNPNEEELITTIQINFIDSAGIKPSKTVLYKDLDGDGGNAPSQWDTIKLAANTTYLASILLLNESVVPVDTISNEVLNENKEHLFCYDITGAQCSVKRTDSDGTYEVGLQTKWTTGSISNGNVNVVLRHQPDTKDGTCAPGASDIDINFAMDIK